jgi:hypothetical protein
VEQSIRPAFTVPLLGESLEEAFDRLAAGLIEDDLPQMAEELRVKAVSFCCGEIWIVG